MLGKTAGGLFWMFRYLERSENTARMLEAGLRMSLTRSGAAESEWTSIITTTGLRDAYLARHEEVEASRVIDFLLRDKSNPGSVLSAAESARNNARLVRTALTREVWEAVNESYLVLKEILARPVRDRELPHVLRTVRQRSGFVRGALHGSMLRNDIYDFARIGSFFERADSTARILDVKYYILLPSVTYVGSPTDNVQWESILRATSSVRAYQTVNEGDPDARSIAEFLILDHRLPRSLAFCYAKIVGNMRYLERQYARRMPSHDLAARISQRFTDNDIDAIFEHGLHEFVTEFLTDSQALGLQIERDYRFNE